MNAREQARFDMLKRVGTLGTNNASDFTDPMRPVQASVEDRLGVPGRIDLNPACAKQLGLNPPFLIKNCVWNWV